MSRISSHASMLASDDRSSSKKNREGEGLDLEGLLAAVVEEEEYIPQKKRNRRKLRPRRQTLSSSDPILRSVIPENEEFSISSEAVDGVKTADSTLVLSIHQKKNTQKPHKIPVSFRPHALSEHVLRLQGMAQSIQNIVREPIERTMHEWVAPYETPPSLERLAAEASDLYIDYVDPQCYFEQFTPADPQIAFQEANGWWARLRAPFIRWEVQRITTRPIPTEFGQMTEVRVEKTSVILPVEDGIVAQSYNDQLTLPSSVDRLMHPVSFKERFVQFFQGVSDQVEERIESMKDREEELVSEAGQAWAGVPVLVPRLDTLKVLAGFVALLFVATLPAGAVSLSRSFRTNVDKTVQQSQLAIDATRQAFESGQPSREALAQATQRFQSAEASLRQANTLALGLANAIPQARQAYRGGQALLQAGEKSTRAAQILSEGMNRAWSIPVHYPEERLQALELYLAEAAPLIQEARKQVDSVEIEALPESVRPRIIEVRQALAQGEASLDDLRTLINLGMLVLGHNEPRTYLFVFQNPSELRPSGGFMGSVAEVIFDRGAMKRLRTPGGGPYDLRNQLTARVLAPQPLQLLKEQWEFQDANWFPDFAATAEKIRWFWSKSGQPTLDGVIAVNASLLEKLLRITGPIEIPEFGKIVSADNVLFELQKSVEVEYDKVENQPKKIIGVLMPKVLEKMRSSSQEDALRYLAVLAEALETKDIQVWMARPDEQRQMETFRLAGRISPTPGDALAVVEANIGGQKTDAVIKEQVMHEVEIQDDGSMIDTVTLTRQHRGTRGELFHGANNVSFVRFYAPQGSELLSANGFIPPANHLFKQPLPTDQPDPDLKGRVTNERQVAGLTVADESNRTSFGGWIQLPPGASSVTTIRYKLPMTVHEIAQRVAQSEDEPSTIQASAGAYLLSLTSQSGKADREIGVRVRVPSTWRVKWASSDWQQTGEWMTLVPQPWNRDRAFGLFFDRAYAQTEKTN